MFKIAEKQMFSCNSCLVIIQTFDRDRICIVQKIKDTENDEIKCHAKNKSR